MSTSDEPATPSERDEWIALAQESLDGLPREALVASVKDLAERLLELTEKEDPVPL